MSIAIDQTSTATGVKSSTFTWAHTVNYVNEILFIITINNTATSQTLGTVTYNGKTFTQVATRALRNGTGDYYSARLWALASPGTGTHNISITPSAATNVTCAACGVCESSITYTGLKQAYNSTPTTSTSSLTTDRTNTESWILSFIALGEQTANPAASGHTPIVTATNTTSSRAEIGYVPTATQLTTQYTWTGNGIYFVASLEVKRASSGGNIMWF